MKCFVIALKYYQCQILQNYQYFNIHTDPYEMSILMTARMMKDSFILRATRKSKSKSQKTKTQIKNKKYITIN